MRILIVYPGHSLSTLDVASGYDGALRKIGHEVRAFKLHNWLAFYHEALKMWSERQRNFNLPDLNAYIAFASDRVIIDAIDFVPDVALVVNGFALHRKTYDLLYALEIPIVLLLTESPYLDTEQRVFVEKGHAAGVFTNDRASLAAYPCPTAYLPHAYDPSVHYPHAVGAEYASDVYFQGTLWPERKALFSQLPALPYEMRVGGIDPSVKEGGNVLAEMVDNAELAKWYSGAKIALNHHRTFSGIDGEGNERHVSAAWSLGPRAYEIAACGAFQLSDAARPELEAVFGGSVATYTDAGDLAAKIDHYMGREALRDEMRREARERVKACTFEERAKNILIPHLEEVLNGCSTAR